MMEIPSICMEKIESLKQRVKEIEARYKSLASYGRPYLEDLDEVACIVYSNVKMGLSLDKLAKMISVDKTSLYKLLKRVENEQKCTIYDRSTNSISIIKTTINELIQRVEDRLQARAKARILDPLESSIIRKYVTSDIPKRAKIEGKPKFLSERTKRFTLTVVRRLMEYFNNNGGVTNPDLWNEDMVEKALFEIYKTPKKIRVAMKAIRTIPEFSKWFTGRIGREIKYSTLKTTFISYEHYIKLKELWKTGKITDSEFLVVWLHLVTGAREGVEVYGVKSSTDLDNCNSSLVGLKWENMYRSNGTWYIIVYESKTNKEWNCDLTWLDPDPVEVLIKYKTTGSIIKTLTKQDKVYKFYMWYLQTLRKISELLDLGFTLKPHDIRRSHISILAELGVPLEVAVTGNMDFGVGWEDLTTAVVYYLRYSKYVKQRIISEIRTRQQEIINQIK